MADYKNKRPESPKGQVRKAFETGGADAARKMADKLAKDGVEGAAEAPKKVDRWLREWGATEANPSPEKPATEPRRRSQPPKKTAPPPVDKRRVYDIGEPNVHGLVVKAGEQVSVVKWDVPSPWGKECNVSNEQLRDVESEPSRQDRYAFFHATAFLVMRKDEKVGQYKTFAKAIAAAGDDSFWVFARTKGGTVALLMRPHWEQYLKLEAAREEAA